MTLTEFYESDEDLIADFRATGHSEDGDAVETALRGGSTSGEILSNLWIVLSRLEAEPLTEDQVLAALTFIDSALAPGD